MRSERGYTLFEILIVIALIGIVSAISVPVFMESNRRNALWTGAEQVGATIRSARFRAISQNTPHRVAFNCPNANELRTLAFQDDPAIDNLDIPTRCSEDHPGDSGVIELPGGITYDADATHLEVNGRGIFTAGGGDIPLTITVTHGGATRILTVSATGQVTFTDVD